MKKYLIFLLAWANVAYAGEFALLTLVPTALVQLATYEREESLDNLPVAKVVASGYGKDYNEALDRAKINALEQVTASWINGDSYVRNGMFSEKITQYNGGVIRSYKVLKNDTNYVVIEAEVVPRAKNGMTTNTANVPSDMRGELTGRAENYQRKIDATAAINDRNKALSFVVEEVNYNNMGRETEVTIIGTMRFQDKWVRDYTELTKEAGELTLPAFYYPLRFIVEGKDQDRVVTSNIVRFNHDVDLYDVVGGKVTIHKKAKERIKLTFIAGTRKLADVERFDIKFN